MARLLTYVDAVPGRLYPLVATLLELQRRGHAVLVKAGADDVDTLRTAGLHAEPLAPPIARFEPDDWKARTRFGALMSGLRQFGERARDQAADLAAAIDAERPDALFIDEGAWGAAAAAERSGLPWAFSLVSPVPLTSKDAPPFGLGLRPRHDRAGRVRDRIARTLTLGSLERIVAREVNGLRADLGVPPFTTIDASYLAADLVLAYTAEPFEYPRSDWPAKVRLVGPGLWEPPAAAPEWLDGIERPLVLVTCSTLFQNDRSLAEAACRAFAGDPLDVVVTTAGVDPASLRLVGQRPRGALRRAFGGAGACRVRRLPRRHGHHAEGARARRPGRRGPVRPRPTGGRPPRRHRGRRRPPARPQAHAGAAA